MQAYLLLVVLLVLVLAAPLVGAEGVTIAAEGGGFTATTAVYTAKVDAQGALASLVIGGREFMAPAAEITWGDGKPLATPVYACPMNRWYQPLPLPGTVTREANTVTAEGHGWKIAYAFGVETIDLTYSGTPEGTDRGFRAGYPPAELCLSLAHDLSRACDPEQQGELGWPVNRNHEPGNFAFLAANGAGFLAEGVCRVQAINNANNLRTDPHRLDLLVFNTYDPSPTPITHRLRCFTRADLAHSLTMQIVSPVPGHLFSNVDQVVFPVKVTTLYGHTLQGGVAFSGAPYVWKEPKYTASTPIELGADQTAEVQLTLKPPKIGHWTGLISVTEGDQPLYSQRIGFVFRPEDIPPAKPPKDFDKFWDDTLAALDKIPLDLTMEEQPDKETQWGKVYKLRYRSWDRRWAWAWLNLPKGEEKVDGYLRLPPVSVWQPPPPNPAGQELCIAVAIHGGDLKDYPAKPRFDYMTTGITSRETYMLRYSYCCLARCYDILTKLDKSNGKVHVTGGSQGAGLSLAMAGLRPVTDAMGAAVALCRIDWTVLGYAQWGPQAPPGEDKERIARIVSYYDPANFAHRIKCPVRLAVGLFDFCAPAEGVISAFNAMPPTTPRQMYVDPYGGHFTLNVPGFWDNTGQPIIIPGWYGSKEENKLH